MLDTVLAGALAGVGVAAGLGTASADGIYALLAVLAGAQLVRLLKPVSDPLRWVSAVVLIAIAVYGLYGLLRGNGNGRRVDTFSPGVAFRNLLGLTLLNPTTVVCFAALVLGGTAGQESLARGLVFALAAFAASAVWQTVLALGGRALGSVLTSPRGRLVTSMLGNALILYFGIRLFWP